MGMRMLVATVGGKVVLPAGGLVLNDRQQGGHLIVEPPRPVWDRTALTPGELCSWSILVAATAAGMLEALPQLHGGCINYWDAGNWSLHHEAEPTGPKKGPDYRRLHLHLLGRSRLLTSRGSTWGEAPQFPAFADRHVWCAGHEPLTHDECLRVTEHTRRVLQETYNVPAGGIR